METRGEGFAARLLRELDRWASEGLISPEQRDRIAARYASAEAAPPDTASNTRMIATISVMGALLVGAGVILFVGSNWSAIPRPARLAMIIIPMLAAYAGGYRLRHSGGSFPKTGAALLLAAAILYGAGIFLVAQMYNVSAHYPNGILMWWLGVLPLAYALSEAPLMALSVVAAQVWLGTEASEHFTGYYGVSELAYVALYMMSGLICLQSGLLHQESRRKEERALGRPLAGVGLFLALASGYALTFEVYKRSTNPGAEGFFIVLAMLFAVSAIWRLVRGTTLPFSRIETAGHAALAALAVAAYYAAGRTLINQNALVIAANVIYAAVVLGVILLGYVRRMPMYVNLGLLVFGADLTARYFDLFWGYLPQSIFFIAGGLILIGGGVFLEKKRRQVLASFGGSRP